MPNRRIPPPPPTAASSSNPFSDPPDITQLPPPQVASLVPFTSSQVSSSSTLVDNHSSSSHTRQHTPVSPVNIPTSNVTRFHSTRNRSTGSSTDFQASPRSFVLEGSSPHHVERSNSPFGMTTSSPSKEHFRHRRGKSSTDQTQDPAVSSRIVSSCGPTALSSDYALGVVFAQFENVADKKMELILNMGVVSAREKGRESAWMMLLIKYEKDAEVDFRKLLAVGADPAFDKLIRSLSSLAICQQKQVIDAVMRWRRAKIEPLDPALLRRVR